MQELSKDFPIEALEMIQSKKDDHYVCIGSEITIKSFFKVITKANYPNIQVIDQNSSQLNDWDFIKKLIEKKCKVKVYTHGNRAALFLVRKEEVKDNFHLD